MITDTNVHLGRWPFRSSPWNTTADIVTKLKSVQVTQAWAGSCEALFDKDLAGVNERLAKECQQFGAGILLPFGSVNPKFPDWRDDITRCVETHGMRGVRLYPGYHGYKLDEPVLADLLVHAATSGLFIQIVMQMEDVRTQHPLMQVAPVDITPLPGLIAKCPEIKVQILNSTAVIPEQILVPLARSNRVFFDFAMIEGVGGVGRFAEKTGPGAMLFGSHFPLFYLESAILKVREAGLTEADTTAIQYGNATRLLG